MPIRPENRDRYPANWPTISARIRHDRAEDQCECDGRCGLPHGMRCEAVNGKRSPYTGSRVVLTVAHLNHDPADCREENLMAACQRCHLAYDAEHHATTRAATRAQELAATMDQLPGMETAP